MKRYLTLTSCLIICLSILASCGQTASTSSNTENIANEVTSDEIEPDDNTQGESSGNTSISQYGGDILIDGILIDYDNFNGHLRVAEGSSHTITLSGFEQYYQDIEYTWTTWQETEDGGYTPIQISDSYEIETDKINKSWYYGVTINYSSSNLASITSPELHFNFQFDVENHFRVYPAGTEDTTGEQRNQDWYSEHVLFPKNEESIILSIEVFGDDLEDVSLQWMKPGQGSDWVDIDGETDKNLIVLREELFEPNNSGYLSDGTRRACRVHDKYNNYIYISFGIELN